MTTRAQAIANADQALTTAGASALAADKTAHATLGLAWATLAPLLTDPVDELAKWDGIRSDLIPEEHRTAVAERKRQR